MVAQRYSIALTPEFIEQARDLSASNRPISRLLSKALDKLMAHPEDPSLHRERLKTPGARLSSSRVNRKYRVIDREQDSSSLVALFVGNHDDAYIYAERYTGVGREEIATLWDDAGAEAPPIPSTSVLRASFLPRAKNKEESASFISAEDLMRLGLSSEEAEHVRMSAWNTIDFKGYFGEGIGDGIETLLAERMPASPKPGHVPSPVPLRAPGSAVTLTEPGQFAAMVDIGLDRYLTTLTDEQRKLAEVMQQGLLVIKGVGGSGKTTVAAYRVKALADRIELQPRLMGAGPRRVLYLCFNKPLADTVERILATLYHGAIPSFVEVRTVYNWVTSYLSERRPRRIEANGLRDAVERACITHRARLRNIPALRDVSHLYLTDEIAQIIVGRGLETQEQYLAADRAGRGRALGVEDRDAVWDIYQHAKRDWEGRGVLPMELAPVEALAHLDRGAQFTPYEAVVLDEAQDLTPVQLRLAQRLVGNDLSRLTIFADAAQSIYRCGFRWKLAELTPRGGQIRTLNQNHRNTVQIQRLALSLLESGDTPEDADAYLPQLTSHRIGPKPELLIFPARQREIAEICERIAEQITGAGVAPQNIAVLAGHKDLLTKVAQGLRAWNIAYDDTSGRNAQGWRRGGGNGFSIFHPGVKLLTLHSAKGLDFPHVYIVDLTADGLPLDPLRDAESYANQRRLLYTAMIRAGQTLTLSSVRERQHRLLQDLSPDLYERREIDA